MKYNLKKPCDECPFRKDSTPGWLGGETPKDTFHHVVNEGSFACHKTRDEKEENMSRCRGSILFLAKVCKMPKYDKILKVAVGEIPYNSPLLKDILGGQEFVKYHTNT